MAVPFYKSIRILDMYGANPLLKNNNGDCALDIAKQENYSEILDYYALNPKYAWYIKDTEKLT